MTRVMRWTMHLTMATVAAVLALPSSARAQDVEVDERGEAVIVDESGHRLEGGGSGTRFALDLPDGAECPGDSAFDTWRVNTYLVPDDVDLDTLEFTGLGPSPLAVGDRATFRQPLFEDTSTSSWVSQATGTVEREGDPGPVVNLPYFSFAIYSPGHVPAGRYHLGVSCNRPVEIGRYWNADIVVTDTANDSPAGFTWAVVSAGPDASSSSSSPVPLIAAGAGVVAAALLLRARRRPSSSPQADSSKETVR